MLMAGRTPAEAAKPAFGTMEELGSLPRWVPALPAPCWMLRDWNWVWRPAAPLGDQHSAGIAAWRVGKGYNPVPGDACMQLCEVCVAPAHLSRGETLLALAGLPETALLQHGGEREQEGGSQDPTDRQADCWLQLWSLGNLSVRKADVPTSLALHSQDLPCKTRK